MNPYVEAPKQMITTAYCSGTTTASGTPVHEGIAAVDKNHMGMIAVVYQDIDGNIGPMIGIFECEDTGFGSDSDGDGIGTIQEGKCIDIYKNDLQGVKEYMQLTGGKCWVQYMKTNENE